MTFLLCFATGLVQAKASYQKPSNQIIANKWLMNCAPGTAKTTLEINNIRAHLRTSGTIFFRDETADAGYEVPKGEGIFSIYAGALWLGALDDANNLKLAAQTYRQNQGGVVDDYWPGPLNNNGETNRDKCNEYDQFWRVTKTEIDAFLADFDDGTIDDPITDNLTNWAGNFVDADGDNMYNPVYGDYPKINGDEAVWSVINDNGNTHMATPGSISLGIEIQSLVYGFNSEALSNITFCDYVLINKSSENLKKAYLGTWIDPDLGNYADDFVGCDTTRNLGICYNGDAIDENNADGTRGYGENPPFIAIQILNGIQTNSGKKLGMASFTYYNNNSDALRGNPQMAEDYYNYLIGKWKDGTPITYGGNGLNEGSTDEAPYMFPSDPTDADGWSECAEGNTPADRRFIMSTGPFDLQPGASKKMTQSVLWIRPEGAFENGCPSFKGLQDLADEVLLFYDENLAGDNIAPVITLNGADFINVEVGQNWSPPTATALDNVDGDLEVIINTSTLNLSENGVYDITYTAVDNNGNSSEIIVTVFVGTGVGVFDYMQHAIPIYPNPVKGWAQIKLNKQAADYIQIYNAQGQLVYTSNLNKQNTTSINLSQLKSGIYINKILNKGKIVSINKFVKR